MFGPIRSVVFDFDGTLVDTMPSVVRGFSEAIELVTGKPVEAEELYKTFGPAPEAVFRQWMPESKIPGALRHWLEFEAREGPEGMKAFPGVEEMLAALQDGGIKLGIFTGRDRKATLRILRTRGWFEKYFTETNIVCGDDGFSPKPKPDPLLHLMKVLNFDPATTLMVGDHPYDILAGKAAGTKAAAALWDMPRNLRSQRARFRESWKKWDALPCDLRLESPASLTEWFRAAHKTQK